eukprot:SAG11_NODE_103_length_16571_cov_49.569208_16_plen_67_part_00
MRTSVHLKKHLHLSFQSLFNAVTHKLSDAAAFCSLVNWPRIHRSKKIPTATLSALNTALLAAPGVV